MKTRSLHITSLCAVLMLGSAGSFAATYNSQLTYRVGEKTFATHVEASASPAQATVFIIHDWDGLTAMKNHAQKCCLILALTPLPLICSGSVQSLRTAMIIKEKLVPCIKTVRSFAHGCPPPLTLA